MRDTTPSQSSDCTNLVKAAEDKKIADLYQRETRVYRTVQGAQGLQR
jgi:hypothetical protein